jgi:hypothetical protein
MRTGIAMCKWQSPHLPTYRVHAKPQIEVNLINHTVCYDQRSRAFPLFVPLKSWLLPVWRVILVLSIFAWLLAA